MSTEEGGGMAVQDFPGTYVDEISDGIFRISTPVASLAGGGITHNDVKTSRSNGGYGAEALPG
jgi:hypothetical protein